MLATTTVGVVDRVHTHTADSGANSEPASTSRLGTDDLLVLVVTNDTDSRVALRVDLADLTGRKLHQRVVAFAVGEHAGLTGTAGNLATASGNKLHVVDAGAGRDSGKRKRAAGLDRSLFSSGDFSTHLKTTGGQDVGTLLVTVFDQGDTSSTVRIVFDSDHLRDFVTTGALEIDETILTLVTTTLVAACDSAVVVPTAGLLERARQILLRLALGDLFEIRVELVPVRRRDWSE